MTKRYLGVGINAYPQAPLYGCINDIKDTVDRLIKDFGFSPKDMRVMYDERAVGDRILSALESAIEVSNQGDLFVFQYSGHGSQVATRDSWEVDGKDEIICPFDFSWESYISDDDIASRISRLSSKGVNSVWIFDSCHSGTIEREPMLGPSSIRYLRPPEDILYRELVAEDIMPLRFRGASNYGGIVISACQDFQTASDAYYKGRYNGAFTRAMLDCIKSDMSYGELIACVSATLSQRGYSQIPLIAGEGQERKLFTVPV